MPGKGNCGVIGVCDVVFVVLVFAVWMIVKPNSTVRAVAHASGTVVAQL